MNLPIDFAGAKNILITGIGGGFDIYAGLPLFHQLKDHHKIVLANYSFAPISKHNGVAQQVLLNDVVTQVYGVPHNIGYHPEGWLANATAKSVYQIAKLGVRPVRNAFDAIMSRHEIDSVIMVDGGFDSLMHGDEDGAGTLLEDSVVLAALGDFSVKKTLVTVGFGTEIEEAVCHHHVLENISELACEGYYYGCCGLLPQMPEFRFYADTYNQVKKYDGFKESHITSRIIPAVEGKFGGDHFLNPLMGIYWFFDGDAVIRKNQLIPKIKNTNLFSDAMVIYRQLLASGQIKRERRPLPY